MKNTLSCDRESFIAWTRGVLLQRHGNKVVVGDRLECQAAEKELEKGRTVLLTVAGRQVSKIRLDKEKGEYVEEELNASGT